jgi:hypothetical protein
MTQYQKGALKQAVVTGGALDGCDAFKVRLFCVCEKCT